MNGRIIKKEKRDEINNKNLFKNRRNLIYLISLFLLIFVVFIYISKDRSIEVENTDEIKEKAEENIVELKPKFGGNINLSIVKFNSLNPYKNVDKSVDNFLRLVFDSLFEYDSEYNLKPELASSYSIENSGKTFRIKINGNARWVNEKRVTAEDVIFTINYIKNNPNTPYYKLVKDIESATSSSGDVIINLKSPNSLNINKLIFPIINKDMIANIESGNLLKIGNGMFKISEYKKGKFIKLIKNTNYYLDKPYIDEITFNIYSDDDIRKNMFLSRNIDLIEANYYELQDFEFDVFRKDSYLSRDFDFILYNKNKYPFDQSTNRKNISKIIDIKSTFENAYRDEISYSEFPISVKLSNINTNDDFKFISKEGKYISNIELSSPLKILVDKSDPMKNKMAYAIKDNLASNGIESDIYALDSTQIKEKIKANDFDLFISRYNSGVEKDITNIFSLDNELFNFDKKEIDELNQNLLQETNKDNIEAKIIKLEKKLDEIKIIEGIGFRKNYVIYSEKIKGVLDSNVFEIYNGIENIFVN